MKHNYFNLNQIKSNPDGQPTVNRQSRLMSYRGYLRNLAMIFAVLTLSMANVGMAWGDTDATISPSESATTSYYFAADGTAITAIAGSGAASASYNNGTPKITVQGIPAKKVATIAFTIADGVTITSFKVNGNKNNNSTYALDGVEVTFGTARTGLSKTGSMSFTITCTDGTSSSSNRNTEISSFTLTYTTSGGGGGGSATGTATITYVLDVTNKGTTLQTITGTGVSGVNTVSATTSTTLLAGGLGTGGSHDGDKNKHNGTRTLGINTLSEETASKYFYVTFNVASGYQITPTAISLKALTIGGNNTSYKAVLTDGAHSITGTVNATSDDEVTLGSWSGLGSTALTGTVTLKLYAWYTTSGTYNAYRLTTPITITGTVAAAASGCPNYSFHTGGDDVKTSNTQSCFVQVGSSTEWQLTDYTIPADTKFFVGERGWWYDDNLGTNNSRSSAQTWASEMYLAKSFDSGDAAGSPKIGQATGATGTVRVYDNSDWNNLNAAFIPDGYKLKIGSTEYPFTLESGNDYRSNLVQMNNSNARSYISVGVINSSSNYVETANTQEMQHLFLDVTTKWSADDAKFVLYDVTHSRFTCAMKQVPGNDKLYEGWVPSDCGKVIFVRREDNTLSFDSKWNQTGDLTLESEKNLFTITDWGTGTWSTYEKKGKFRMYDNSKDKNWYVHFYPYNVLTYNANTGSGTMTPQSVASDAGSKNVTVLANGFTAPTGYQFDHWDTAPDGSGTDYAPDATYNLTADATLYAIWTPKTINITLNKGEHGAADQSATVAYDATALTSITDVTPNTGYSLTGYYDGETKVLNANGTFAEANVSGYITSSKWTKATDCTLTAKWECVSLTVNLGGDASTPAGGSPIGTEYTLNCSASTGVIASYQWKQNTTASTAGAVNAEGTGATTASFNPVPAAAGTYYYYCVATDACGNSKNTSYSGAFQFNEPADPCSEPAEVTNEIARFFVPCNQTTGNWNPSNVEASTGDNTFSTSGSYLGGSGDFGGSNWKRNATTGFKYAKMQSSTVLQLKLKSGNFQAGDNITVYMYNSSDNIQMNTGSDKSFGTSSASGYDSEYMRSKTLAADNIEADGSIKIIRNSGAFINRIIVTRPPVAATITATLLTPEYMPTGATGVQIGVTITGASTGWYYRVKKGGGYETPGNTTYTTTTWTMTSTIGAGANTYTVELYNGSDTKMAESNAVIVTGETGHPMTIAAGEGGSASPASTWANGDHLHPEITATPASGYHFVNWTKNNENATLADASSATTTITNASGACTITANFEADDACPTAASGGTVYKLQIKTGLTNGDLASTGTTTLTTENYLSEAITNGSASVTSPSAGNAKIADTKAICLDNGSAYITLNLDCPIQEHDIIKYTITQQNGGLYKAATRSNDNLLLQLTKTANSSTVGQIEVVSGSKLIGKTTLYLFAKSNGAYNYYFEIIRPIKITLDATTNGGTAVDPIYGATEDKVVLPHAFKSGSRFNGWYTAASEGTKQADYYTITTGTTLFAQFTAGCAVTGTMFSLSFPSSLYPASNTTVPANSSMNLLQYATITGGAAIAENTNSSAKGSMQTNGKFVLDDAKVCVHITLDCPLQLNDVISTTIETQNLSYTATSTRSTTNYFTKGTNQTTTITADHVLLNSREIYIWTHTSSGGKLISINISRPVGTKYSVTYDGNDKTSGSVPTDDNEYDPADEVTTAAQGSLAKTNYTFGGWNTANDGTGTNTAAGSTFSITDNTTLYAKWTQTVTLDANTANHGSTGGSATAVWNATGLTGITHATPAAGYKLIGYYTTATNEPTTGVKVLNASGTFSSTTVADYITSGKWSRTGEAPTLYARYEASAGLTWNLTVNAKIDLTTESKTSDYPQVGSMTDVATNGLSVSKSAKANLTSIIQTVSSLDPDKYVKATFVVASGYKFTPSKIKLKVQPKDNAETIKVVLTDGVRTYEHDFGSQSAGSIHSLEATNADADKYMQGTVTLKIYAYGNTTGYRLGTPITIEGAVTATCDMPTYTSVDHGATEYQEGDEAESLSVVGGAHVNTYQWYWNTANDRSDVSKTAATAADGTGYNTYTFTPQTTSAYSRYYWCELTATDCGTIKTEAVGITVTEVKTSASIDWTDPVGTVHYGGGGYTIKATVKETTWAGGPEDLTLSAPEGIRIYNVTRGTTDSKDWIQANFDVQTSFDRETYSSSIPFVVSAPAQTGWDAINDEHGVTYDACAGGGGEGSAFIEVTSGVTTANTGMSNYWEAAGVGRLNKAYNQAMGSSADAQTIAGHAFSYRTGANNSNWMVNTYIAGVTKIRLYFYASAAIASAKLGISKVLYDTEYFNSQGSRAVVFDNVATSADSYAVADKGWIEFTLPEMAANSYCYFATNTGNLYIYGVELFSGSVGTGGTETTNLTWSNGTVDGGSVTGKTQSSANFTITATRDAVAEKSLGAITYSSSNTSCATVDSETGEVTITATGASELTTTITATLAASGCYKKKEITYTLTIPGVTCSIETGTLTSDVTSKCSTVNATLTLTGFESGASIQWYKGESTISDDATYHITTEGTTSTLVTKEAGTYSVMVSKTTPTSCSDRSNSITISNASASASATKIVDSWYVKNGRLTPDIELWSVSEGATLGSVAWSPANETGLNCVLRDGIVYLEGKEPNANESGADKVYTLTLTLKDACGGDHEEITKTITITHQKNTDKHVLAFVVNGTKNGGFTAGISADQTTNLDLYKKISAEFDVLATNAYATDDEKALKQYYSQFDILCITDYPNTGEKGNNKKSYIDAMGSIVDIRPILTMEAFVAKWGNWKAKDISGTPHSPDPRQYAMDLQCKDHEIFDGTHPEVVGEGDEAMYRVTMVDATKEDYATLDGNTPGTDAYDADDYPALQGFEFDATMAADGLLPLGQIYNGSPTNTLQVGIERQTEMSARLMVLGIQQLAMERLTADGQTVVINALKYLMKKNEEEIADCSVAFVGGAEDGLTTDWNNDANWSTGKKPDKTTREVRILAPVVITNSQTITSPTIKIADGGTYDGGTTANGSITINAGGALKVKGEVVGVTAPAYSKKKATDPSKLVLNTSKTAQSALILDNENGMTRATVNLYSLGRKIDSKYQFQYYAVPMEVVPVNPSFAGTGIYTYVWHENGGWERRGYYTDLYAFEGIGITTSGADPRTYTMAGNLASTADKEITLTKESDGENIIGNSWTAPINIASLRTGLVDDANIVDKTVYIYITGNDNMVGDHSTKEVAGKWLAIPIDASGWPDWTGQKVIPAMQAFYIKANAATTLTLNYDEMVRTTPNGELNRPLKAPRRAPLSDDAISLLKLRVEDSSTHTDLYLFEGNRFSDSYDNGWEAKQMGGDGCMQLYAQNEADKMAVLATDELEGTVVGFEPGKETGYTISFSGEGNGYYLNDIKLQNSVRISEGETYTFTFEEGDAANRFYISRTAINAPAVATGMENLDAAAPKVQKIIYNDKLYIIRGGRLYDATGKVVK